MIFGVKAVTYAIKHGLGVGHSLKSRSYQVRVKKISTIGCHIPLKVTNLGFLFRSRIMSHPSPKAGQQCKKSGFTI